MYSVSCEQSQLVSGFTESSPSAHFKNPLCASASARGSWYSRESRLRLTWFGQWGGRSVRVRVGPVVTHALGVLEGGFDGAADVVERQNLRARRAPRVLEFLEAAAMGRRAATMGFLRFVGRKSFERCGVSRSGETPIRGVYSLGYIETDASREREREREGGRERENRLPRTLSRRRSRRGLSSVSKVRRCFFCRAEKGSSI